MKFPKTGTAFWVRIAARGMTLAGILLCGTFLAARLYAVCFSHVALWQLKAAEAAGTDTPVPVAAIDPASNTAVDFSLWGEKRIRTYLASIALKGDVPIAALTIPRLKMSAPVFEGTDDLTLDRGLGRVDGTGRPGGAGNLAIAGHRDGFFRGLKDIQTGDEIEVESPRETDTYTVESTTIVNPTDVSVLRAEEKTTLTLITCYPFYFVGDAPHRFIVRAALHSRSPQIKVGSSNRNN